MFVHLSDYTKFNESLPNVKFLQTKPIDDQCTKEEHYVQCSNIYSYEL